MGKYLQMITYKGKEIMFMNTAGVSEEGGIEAWQEMKRELLRNQDIHLILVDGSNIAIAPASVSKAKEAASVIRQDPRNRVAFVGLTALQKSTAQLIAKGIHVEAQFFKTQEEGKEWLVAEANKPRQRPG